MIKRYCIASDLRKAIFVARLWLDQRLYQISLSQTKSWEGGLNIKGCSVLSAATIAYSPKLSCRNKDEFHPQSSVLPQLIFPPSTSGASGLQTLQPPPVVNRSPSYHYPKLHVCWDLNAFPLLWELRMEHLAQSPHILCYGGLKVSASWLDVRQSSVSLQGGPYAASSGTRHVFQAEKTPLVAKELNWYAMTLMKTSSWR